ncbi:MAG TPA: Flp pilus assembly protein CpaB [Alphaproteobacteria bacterium]|nr:Flp pilus assembly protein CpaB [Alphaproteobacteria bacterium]
MRVRVMLFAGFALLLALGTIYFARTWLSHERAEIADRSKAEPAGSFVLVAAKPLAAGSYLRADDLRWQAWPAEALDGAYLVKGKATPQSLAGSVVRQNIAAGEPITVGRVVKPGGRGFLAALLSPGMRAVSVQVTATSDVAGMIFPGDKVDLILSHQIRDDAHPNAPARMASETVLRDLRVLAVDQRTADPTNAPVLAKTVTFEVTPKEAEIIEVASNLGNLSLSLRSLARGTAGTDADNDDPSSVTHTWDSEVSPLIVHGAPPPPPHPAAIVTVLRGDMGQKGGGAGHGGNNGGGPGSANGTAGMQGALSAMATP